MTFDWRADPSLSRHATAIPDGAGVRWVDHGAPDSAPAPSPRWTRPALANAVAAMIAASFALTPLFAPIGWNEVAAHLATGAAALFLGILMWRAGVMPAATVKLTAALAVWFGPDLGLAGFLLATAALTCAAALAALALPRAARAALPMWPLAVVAFVQIYPQTASGRAVATAFSALV